MSVALAHVYVCVMSTYPYNKSNCTKLLHLQNDLYVVHDCRKNMETKPLLVSCGKKCHFVIKSSRIE
jgi:hypothetical protein